jgi:hypothetical protein
MKKLILLAALGFGAAASTAATAHTVMPGTDIAGSCENGSCCQRDAFTTKGWGLEC